MLKFLNKQIFLHFIFGVFFLPNLVLASTIYLDTEQKEFFVGDNVIINFRLDSEGKSINVIDGNLNLEYDQNLISVSGLNVADSDFSLWPRRPSLDKNQKKISFVGGVPKGLKSNNALVFKVILNLEKAGRLVFNPRDLAVYLNDGKGTKDKVDTKSFVVDILPAPAGRVSTREWESVISNDHTPPEFLKIEAGQDETVFGGKKFLVFDSKDRDSGVAYFEVKEGDLPAVRSGNIYVLQQSEKSNSVVVTVFDSANNSKTTVYNRKLDRIYYIIVLTALAFCFLVIFRKKINVALIK